MNLDVAVFVFVCVCVFVFVRVCVFVLCSSQQLLVCENPCGKHAYPNLLTSVHMHARAHVYEQRKSELFLTLDRRSVSFFHSLSSIAAPKSEEKKRKKSG